MSAPISVEDALARIGAHSLPRETETIPVTAAAGRRLAAPVIAGLTQPPAAVSAMDGYAVRFADVQAPGARLKVIGTAPAGQPFDGKVGPGEAVRIFTGGQLPDGSDHIVIQEDTSRDGEAVLCQSAYTAPQFVRAAGIDFRKDEILIPAGKILSPAMLSLAAAANAATVEVERRLRIGILANGNELRPTGSVLAPGQIVNSNPAGLGALVAEWGGTPVDLGIAADSVESILDKIQHADIDIFLPVGGASVGDHDHMQTAFSQAGFEPVFSKIAVKPGKPTWFSRRNNQLALGLPGNPASALVCAHLFLKPLLTREFGLPVYPAVLTASLGANGSREQFLRASVHVSSDGTLCTAPLPNQDSSLLKPFLTANALIRRTAGAAEERAGARVQIILTAALNNTPAGPGT